MSRNAILEDLHAVRLKILADCEGDTATYLREAHERLAVSGRPISHRPQRPIRQPEPVIPPDTATEAVAAALLDQ